MVFSDSLLILGKHDDTSSPAMISKAFLFHKGEYADSSFKIKGGSITNDLADFIDQHVEERYPGSIKAFPDDLIVTQLRMQRCC